MLFLGQKMSVVGGAKGSEGDKRPMLGAVPALEHEVETLELLLAEEGTISKGLHKSMMASYGLYNKSRPSASKQSVQRARELLEECGGPARLQGLIHPSFRQEGSGSGQQVRGIGAVGNDDASLAYIQELRSYRPKVEKVGNVISTAATRIMEQSKRDVKIVAATKAECEARLGD